MILAYGIVTVLAVIVGSVTGHTLTKHFAKRMNERQFNRAFLKALEEVAEDAIKDIERIKFYEKIKAATVNEFVRDTKALCGIDVAELVRKLNVTHRGER